MNSDTFGSSKEAQILLDLSNKYNKVKAVSRTLEKYNRRMKEVVHSNLNDKEFHLKLLLEKKIESIKKLEWKKELKTFFMNVVRIKFRNYLKQVKN